MPRRCGRTKAKHTQFTRGSPGPIWYCRVPQFTRGSTGPIWYCRVPRNHDNDTGDIASGHQWPILCTHRVYKAKFLLLDPKCPVGAAEPRPNTRNPHKKTWLSRAYLVLEGKCQVVHNSIRDLNAKVPMAPYRPADHSK
jgi:hypothetical protein